MIGLYPQAQQSWAARSELAEALIADDPERARALYESSVQYAIEHNDSAHYGGAMFGMGTFYSSTGEPAKARAAFEEVLQHNPTLVVKGEALFCIAETYAREGDLETAFQRLDEIAGDVQYPLDIRGTAALTKASELRSAGFEDEAYAALQAYLAEFPEDRAAVQAAAMLPAFARPQVVIIRTPGCGEGE
jgi:tetratricopeptide (TPR) repeat protein